MTLVPATATWDDLEPLPLTTAVATYCDHSCYIHLDYSLSNQNMSVHQQDVDASKQSVTHISPWQEETMKILKCTFLKKESISMS